MTGLSLSDVKKFWILPAAQVIGLADPAHVNIATGIGAVESAYRVMTQMGGGPARGFWQMEIATHDSLWANTLIAPSRSKIAAGLHSILGGEAPSADLMISLPLYGAAMCITRVFIAPEALPAANGARGLCEYWKSEYNTSGGAGAVTPDRIALFQSAIEA